MVKISKDMLINDILAEYGTAQKLTYAMPAHFKEHFTAIMPEEALQTLSAL